MTSTRTPSLIGQTRRTNDVLDQWKHHPKLLNGLDHCLSKWPAKPIFTMMFSLRTGSRQARRNCNGFALPILHFSFTFTLFFPSSLEFVFDHRPVSVSREEPWCVTRKRDYISIKSEWSKSENGAIKMRLTEITENWSKFERKWRVCNMHVTREKGWNFSTATRVIVKNSTESPDPTLSMGRNLTYSWKHSAIIAVWY